MPLFSPTFFYRRVTDIDLAALRDAGVDTLLVDIDNTILPRDTGEMAEELTEWSSKLLGEGFKVCLVSNNWHDHVKRIADSLGLCMVPRALKPLPFGFRSAVRLLGSHKRNTAVIGDQMFTDILGGNLLGMTTVMVLPLSESDLPHTLILRRLERMLLAGRAPLP
ncbi:MAG TPA: YqeG family HAD IIIA-type phosphatase [Coriobacteriia bacterium]|nr:YqeG family HAD IIIA-type phosphatase [Coriobacteriia bacterium]